MSGLLLRQLPHLGVTQVVGGSGTGKTEIIAAVAAKLLITKHAQPHQIAVLCASGYETTDLEARIQSHGVSMYDMTDMEVRHVSALTEWCAVEDSRASYSTVDELLSLAQLKDTLPSELQRAAEGAPQRVLQELSRTFHALQSADVTPAQLHQMAAAEPSSLTLGATAEAYSQYLEMKFSRPLTNARDRVPRGSNVC